MQRIFPDCRPVQLEEVYADLAFSAPPDRPYVIVNMVSSVDGKTTIDGELRRVPIGSPVDRALMEWVRHPVDVVLRGAETVRVNPRYPGVSGAAAAARHRKGLEGQPLPAVVTRSCNLPFDGAMFGDATHRPIVLTARRAPTENLAKARSVARVLTAGDDEVDVTEALRLLRDECGARCVLLEGGPTLNYAFLESGLVDEIFWTVAPKCIGGRSELNLVDGEQPLAPLPQLELVTAYAHESELFLRYRVK